MFEKKYIVKSAHVSGTKSDRVIVATSLPVKGIHNLKMKYKFSIKQVICCCWNNLLTYQGNILWRALTGNNHQGKGLGFKENAVLLFYQSKIDHTTRKMLFLREVRQCLTKYKKIRSADSHGFTVSFTLILTSTCYFHDFHNSQFVVLPSQTQ